MAKRYLKDISDVSSGMSIFHLSEQIDIVEFIHDARQDGITIDKSVITEYFCEDRLFFVKNRYLYDVHDYDLIDLISEGYSILNICTDENGYFVEIPEIFD